MRPRQRRQLITQRLAAARGQHGQNILARQGIGNDLFLVRPERVKAKVLAEQVAQLVVPGFHSGCFYPRRRGNSS
jgi:hypothetical protein